MKVYLEKENDVLEDLQSGRDGLSSEEAERRLSENGKNELKEEKGKSLFQRFIEQLMDPMILVLLAAAIVSAIVSVMANESFTDTIIILVVVIANAVLGVYQENKAEKAIEALQKMSAATSKVRRNGEVKIIPSSELVVGDIIELEAGDSVPADARILESADLQVEEAALTGESVPVNKIINALEMQENMKDIPLGDRRNMVYMGSDVVYGRGEAVITATGMNTEMGKIADALQATEDEKTPLQKKLAQLSKILTYLVLGISVVVFLVQVLRAGSFNINVALQSFMTAVSLAVAAIPEGLAAVVTVVLSMGVTKMADKKAIVRKLTAVETLGCTQVICTDKTGTLTKNQMTVTQCETDDEKELAVGMGLCNDSERDSAGEITGEATEAALLSWAYSIDPSFDETIEALPRVDEVPFDSMRKMMTTIHQKTNGYVQYTKGAPDMILDHCSTYLDHGEEKELTEEIRREILVKNKAMADQALRVLACAKVERPLLDQKADVSFEENMCFIGLCGMIDPIRPEVQVAMEQCQKAGIRPVMITGDHVDTASAIGRELGMLGENDIAITGAMLDEMDEEEFMEKLPSIRVYARVQPEHKTRIVNAWKKAGYVTAMTGDGVNDAPSIKAADIGIGMGITGTDVTKNVADVVLEDDNFSTIVGAVEEGRRIYDNIRKAIQYLLSSNLSEVLSVFISTLLGFTVLKPAHLLWINLVTDTFPALGLGMEEAEGDVMSRKPRDSKDGIFAQGMGGDIAYQGAVITILTLLSYWIGIHIETGSWAFVTSTTGMTMAFITLAMCQIFHSFNMRSQKKSLFSLHTQNRWLLIAGIISFITTTLVCEIPVLASIFGFTSVSLSAYLTAMGLGFCIIPLVEIVKKIQSR